jgi:sugar phosphate isomerase/epimerase
MSIANRPRLSVSTWSLHRSLGKPAAYGPETTHPQPATPTRTPAFSLLELPAQIVAAGMQTLEICHFHLPSREAAYLQQLRQALADAGVELWSLLIDGGDIAHPTDHERDVAWIEGWFPVAAQLGANHVRVSGGKQTPTPEAVARSEANFARLAIAAQQHGLRLMTENWQNLLSTPAVVRHLLDRLGGQVGLCADFGNWHRPEKYANLAQIVPYAESCHAKCHFPAPGVPDREDFVRCLELTRSVGFAGPYTLIYDGPGDDELAGLGIERELVLPYL